MMNLRGLFQEFNPRSVESGFVESFMQMASRGFILGFHQSLQSPHIYLLDMKVLTVTEVIN